LRAFDLANGLRHLAICTALIVVWVMRRELQVGVGVLGVLTLAALVNFASLLIADNPRFATPARILSTVLAVGGWAALAFLTGGVNSPLVAGLWLEVVFSGIVFRPLQTLLVTCGVMATLWLPHVLLGPGAPLGRLWLHTACLGVIGVVTFLGGRRWDRLHQAQEVELRALRRGLMDLEAELDAARSLSQVGERVARLAHSVKGTVHSLRGFASLMGMPQAGEQARELLEGLRVAIDHLEETARLTLGAGTLAPRETETTSTVELRHTLDEVLAEMRRRHAGLRWIEPVFAGLPAVALRSEVLREVLLILAQNAAEASGSNGEVVLRAGVEGRALCLSVEDGGAGLAPEIREKLFRPGATTKASGSGFGLFLARRLVESCGGRITVGQAEHGGALVSVRVPVLQN
jgi:signal transduction histidine kinase